MASKNSTGKKNFYLPLLDELKHTTNLTKIGKKLGLSKQQLNYYLRRLREKGLIIKKGQGWYEVKKGSKRPTKYGSLLPKDFIRGHGYVLNILFPKEIEGWDKRISLLDKKNYNYKLVGALKNTPRIKVLGRKVWLCNNHIKIFEKKDKSYYGENAVDSRARAFEELLDVIRCLENKLGINLAPYQFEFRKEHYALIKNDLAIDHNKKGIIMRIKDKDGEWLLVDDSLGMGGELETIGKKSLTTNIQLQKWWNDNKETKFKVTPTFILDAFNKTQTILRDEVEKNNQLGKTIVLLEKQIQSHLELINEWRAEAEARRNEYSPLKKDNDNLNSSYDKKL